MTEIRESKRTKTCRSEKYNYLFNKVTGFFARWGETEDDDPLFSPVGPEILDLEICSGECLSGCNFCYKRNGSGIKTENMSMETFREIFHKLPKSLTQIAFGITNISTNPFFFNMMKYARTHGVIPNYTCHGLDVTPEIAKTTAEICGAVAVSVYNREKSYDAIKMFTDEGMTQVNIHFMLSEETYDKAFSVVDDMKTDPRLAKMNAIVFLQYKHKNKDSTHHSISSPEKYKRLVDYCTEKEVKFGFDSCSAPLYLKSIEGQDNEKKLAMYAEPCESSKFSMYISVDAKFYPCSFMEKEGDWKEGIDILKIKDFLKELWFNERVITFRNKVTKCTLSGKACPHYDLC